MESYRQKPDAIEAEFASLNEDTGYTLQYLAGHNPSTGCYIFQPLLKTPDKRIEAGYNLEPMESTALKTSADLLKKSLSEKYIDAEVIHETFPTPFIKIIRK